MGVNRCFHILGAGCGGTSLLAGLLDFHSQICVGFELYAMQYLLRPVHRWPLPDFWHARVRLYRSSIKRLTLASSKPFFANKITTEQLSGLLLPGEPVLSARNRGRLSAILKFQLFGEKIVLLSRDGRTCIPSKMIRGGHSLDLATARWISSCQLIHYLHASSSDTYLLRYEDLVANPALQLARICHFLGVPYEPSMMQGTSNSKMHPRYQSLQFKNLPSHEELPLSVIEKIAPFLALAGYEL